MNARNSDRRQANPPTYKSQMSLLLPDAVSLPLPQETKAALIEALSDLLISVGASKATKSSNRERDDD